VTGGAADTEAGVAAGIADGAASVNIGAAATDSVVVGDLVCSSKTGGCFSIDSRLTGPGSLV
jgi:hypothetical protein